MGKKYNFTWLKKDFLAPTGAQDAMCPLHCIVVWQKLYFEILSIIIVVLSRFSLRSLFLSQVI